MVVIMTTLYFRTHPLQRFMQYKDSDHMIRSHLYEEFNLEKSEKAVDHNSLAKINALIYSPDYTKRREYRAKYMGAHQSSSRGSPFISGCIDKISSGQVLHAGPENIILAFNLPDDYFIMNPMGGGEKEYLTLHYIEKRYFLGVVDLEIFKNKHYIHLIKNYPQAAASSSD
jgi:hypothetical protein